MSFWSKVKKAFTKKVNVKNYTKGKKTTAASRKGKVVKKGGKTSKVTAKAATKSGTRGSAARDNWSSKASNKSSNTHLSRKGKTTTPAVKKTVKKYSEVGKTKAKEQKEYESWKKQEKILKREASKDNPISVKRGRSYYLKNNIDHTTGVGDDGKRKAYKTTKEFYQKNPVAQKRQADIVKGQYQYGNKAYAGATDRLKQNLGMKTKSEQADERLGTNIDKSKAVQKTKKSKGYEAGQFIGDVAAFAAPGMAEENIARGILSGSTKAVKAASAGIRGAKVLSTAEKTAAKALIKNDKVRKFAAERTADALVSSPMNLAAASADSEDGKGTLKNFAMNVAGDVAMGSAMSALKAGKTKAGKIEAVRTAKADAKRAEKARAEKAVADEAKRWETKSSKTQSAVKSENKSAVKNEKKSAPKSTSNMDVNARLKALDTEYTKQARAAEKNSAKIKKQTKFTNEKAKEVSDYFDSTSQKNEILAAKAARKEASAQPQASVKTETLGQGKYRRAKSSSYSSTPAKINTEMSSKTGSGQGIGKVKESAGKVKFWIQENFIDKNTALQKSVENKANSKEASAAIYATDTLQSKVDDSLSKAQRNYAGTEVIGRSANDILEPLKKYSSEKYSDWNEYVTNKDNLARAMNGKDKFGLEPETGYARSLEIVKSIEAKYRGDTEFFKMADEISNFSLNHLEKYYVSGLASKADVKYYYENNPYHITAYRDLKAKELEPNTKSSKVDARGITAAEGSSKSLLSVEEQIITEAGKAQRMADINFMLREIAKGKKLEDGKGKGLDFMDDEVTDAFPLTEMENGAKVGFFENGQRKYMFVTKNEAREIERLINNRHFETGADAVLDATTGRVNKAIKTFSTTLSPTFPFKNFVRDVQLGLINSIDTKAFVSNVGKAIKSLGSGDEWEGLFSASGAKMSNFMYNEKGITAQQKMALADITEKMMNGGKVTKDSLKYIAGMFKKPIEAIECFNNFLESITRHTEFITMGEKIMKEKGYTDISQFTKTDMNIMAQAASEVSANFARSGYVGKWVNSKLVPFFNAGIQGTSREFRLAFNAVKTKDIKTILGLSAKLAMFGLAPAAVNEVLVLMSDDEKFKQEYNEISEFKRLQNYFFKVGDVWLQVPAGRLNAIVGMASRLTINSKNYSYGQAFKTILELAAPANVFTDNVISPIYRSLTNKTWYGADINNQGEVEDIESGEKKAYEIVDGTTSGYAKALSEGLYSIGAKLFGESFMTEHYLTPGQIDALLDQYGGSWAKILHTATSQNSHSQNPLLQQIKDAFSVDPVAKNSLQTNFYKKLHEVEVLKNSRKNSEKYEKEYEKLQNYSYRLTDINNAIYELQKDENFDEDTALRIRELQKYRNQIIRNAISGKSLKDGYKGLDVQFIREKVGNDKIVANNILFKKDDNYESKEEKILKKYKNYSKVLDVYEDAVSFGGNNKAYALALAKNNADKKLVYAYGVSQDEIKEAKKAVKAGITYKELSNYYTSIEKTKKKMGLTGDYTPTFVNYLAMAKAGASANLATYMMGGTANSRAYHQRKLNAAYAAISSGLTLKELSKARTNANTGKLSNPKDYLTDSSEATSYIEKHYKNKSTAVKAILWESLCNSYSDDGKNPYGEVPKAKLKSLSGKTYNNKKVKEISKDLPTVIGNSQMTKKEKNSLANKAWLLDKLAVANKAKAVAKGKANVSTLLEEIDKQSGNNGLTRMTRSYFKKAKTSSVKTEGSSSGGRSYRKKSYSKRSGGSSGRSSSYVSKASTGSHRHSSSSVPTYKAKTRSVKSGKTVSSSHSSVTVKAAKRTITSAGSASYKKTKAYGMTDAEINALYKKLVKEYGESTASKVMLKLSTVIK